MTIVSVYGKFGLMREMGIANFKARCLKILKEVKDTGKPLLVTKRGEPIAQIVPPPVPERPASWLGCMRGSGKILGDVIKPVIGASGKERTGEIAPGHPRLAVESA